MEKAEQKYKVTGKALLLYLAVGAGILMYVASGITTTDNRNKSVEAAITSNTSSPTETAQPAAPVAVTSPIAKKTEPTPDKIEPACYQWANLSSEDVKKAKTLLDVPSISNLTVDNSNQKIGVAVITPEEDVTYEEVASKIRQVGADPNKVIVLKSGKEAWPILVTNDQQTAQNMRAKLQKMNVPGITLETKAGPQNITFYSTSLKVVQKINEYATNQKIPLITYCPKK